MLWPMQLQKLNDSRRRQMYKGKNRKKLAKIDFGHINIIDKYYFNINRVYIIINWETLEGLEI